MMGSKDIIRRKFRAPCWEFFKAGEDRQSARCLVCDKVISTRSHPTLGLKFHLKTHQRGGELAKFREGVGFGGSMSGEEVNSEMKVEPPSPEDEDADELEEVTARDNKGVEEMEKIAPTGPLFRSPVWDHFIPGASRKSAKCRLCDRVISTRTHPTLGLKSHLRSLHSDEFSALKEKIKLSQDLSLEGVANEGDKPGPPGNQSQTRRRKDEPEQDITGSVPEADEDSVMKMGTVGGKDVAIRRHFRSPVWEWFLPGASRQTAKCKICGRIVSTRTHPTLGLKSHLRYNHGGHLGELRKEIGLNKEKDPRPAVWFNRGSSPKQKKRFRAPAWEFFNPIPFTKSARCRICERVISTKTHSTLGLKSHLKIHQRGRSLNALRKMIKLSKEEVEEDEDQDQGSQAIQEEDDVMGDPEDHEGLAAEGEVDDSQMDMDDVEEDKVATVTVTRRQLRSKNMGGSRTNHNQPEEDEDVDSCFACCAYISPRLKSTTTDTSPEQYQFLLTEMLELPKERSQNYLKQLQNPNKWIVLCESCQTLLGEGLSYRKIMTQLQDQLDKCQRRFLNKIKAQAEMDRESSMKRPTKQHRIVDGIRSFVKEKKYSILNEVVEVDVDEPAFAEPVSTSEEDVADTDKSDDLDCDLCDDGKVYRSRALLSAHTKRAHGRARSSRKRSSLSRSSSTKSDRTIKIKINNQENSQENGASASVIFKNYRYDCPNCPSVKDYTLEMFAQHLAIHQRRPYQCSSCSEFFPVDENIQEQHWREKHSDTDHPSDLDKFVQIKLDPGKIWKCESCLEGFFLGEERDQHELSCLPLDKQNARESSELSHHQCQQCPQEFRNLDEWRLHRALYHPEVDRMSCYYCDHSFGEETVAGEEIRNDKRLIEHMKKEHHGTVIVIYDECEFCGVVFDGSGNDKRDHLVKYHGIFVDGD